MATGTEVLSAFVRFFVKDAVSGDAKKVEKAAEKAADGMDEAAKAAGDRLKKGLDKAKGACGTLAKGLGALGAGVGAGVGALVGISAATEETAENMAKLDAAIEASGNTTKDGMAAYESFYGLLGDADTATEATQNLLRLTDSTEELNKWANISAGAFAQFGDALPLENLAETAAETAATGAVVGSMADALNWSTASSEQWGDAMSGNEDAQAAWNKAIADGATKEDAFNAALAACSDEQERATLITDTLNGVYGETGEYYRENNADLIASREAQAQWGQTLAKVGEAIRPFVTKVTEIGTAVLEKVVPYLQQLTDYIREHMPEARAAVDKVKDAFKWFIDFLPTILPILAAVLGGFIAYKTITAIMAAVNAAIFLVKNATTLWRAAQLALNTALKANPIGIVVTIIGALVAAIVTAWNTNEGFRNAVIGAWNKIKDTAASVFNGIKTTISNVMSSISNTVKGVIDKIKGFFNFKVSLPKIKLPHFSIKPAGWEIGDLLKGSIPSLGIEWYAKGAVFDQPTLFATNSGLKGVGEAGAEAVAPVDVLQRYIAEAVAAAMQGAGGGYVANINVTTGETSEAKLARLIAREQKKQAYALGVV